MTCDLRQSGIIVPVLRSWDELIDKVGPRPGMYVGVGRYSLVRSFVEGFGAARDDGVLHGFQQWLSSQPQHRAISNFTWSSLLLHEVFPDRTRVTKPSWQEDPATADPSWPLPPPSPVSEDDLVYPDDDAKAAAGLDPGAWTPRELRHSFVSLMSDPGVPIERISQLVGHSGTTVTEEVYRKQIRPVLTEGAEVMDRLFPRKPPEAGESAADA